MNISSRFTALFVLASSLVLMGEDCGPAGGIHPAYVSKNVSTDDTLVGSYIVVSSSAQGKKRGTATITKEDTADGPSYVLSVNDPSDATSKDVRFRMFLIDGTSFVDVVAESTAKKKRMSEEWSIPVHLYMKRSKTSGDGLLLEFLKQAWVDKDKTIATITPPRDYRVNEKDLVVTRAPVLSGDTAAVQALLKRAPVDAWDVGIELAKAGAPVLDFTLTSGDATIVVTGSKIEVTSTGTGKGKGRVSDVKKIDELVKAFTKAPQVKGGKECVTIAPAKPRCTNDVALREAIMKDVKTVAAP